MSVFVPFSEAVLEVAGTQLGDLVPFQQEYQCVRLLDGTYDFSAVECAPQSQAEQAHKEQPQTAGAATPSMLGLDSAQQIGHAA